VHALKTPPVEGSSLHWNVEPVSVAVNGNEAEATFVGLAGRGVPSVVSGGVVSSVKLRGDDHAETLPTASVARASHKYVPSVSDGLTVAVGVVPLPTDTEEPVATAVEHEEVGQTWNPTVPVSPESTSLNDALRTEEFVRTPSAGALSEGTFGAVVSSVKLRIAVHPDVFPGLSFAFARQ
jgi:hypothetical protein